MLLPILWVASPFWVLFLLLVLKKRQSKQSVWGFLLPIQESAASQSKWAWPWWRIVWLSLSGILCFICLSLPFKRELVLHLEEPSLLQHLTPTQKQALGQQLKAGEYPNLLVRVQTPQGNFLFKSQNLESLFEHRFSKPRTENWYERHVTGHEMELEFNDSQKINHLGIFGLVAQKDKLLLAIWSKLENTALQLSYDQTNIDLPSKPWQFVEVPSQALGKNLSLTPIDDHPLDNHISLQGFQLQNLKWSNSGDLTDDWKSVLEQQKLWVHHQDLLMTNRANEISQQKSIHLISKPQKGLSQALAPDLYRQLYSTLHLNQSSRHHSLDWPLSHSPQISLIIPEAGKALWFNEQHVFALKHQSSIFTCLDDSSFKANLNDNAKQLLLNELYPNLRSPWLIRRETLTLAKKTLEAKAPPRKIPQSILRSVVVMCCRIGFGNQTKVN